LQVLAVRLKKMVSLPQAVEIVSTKVDDLFIVVSVVVSAVFLVEMIERIIWLRGRRVE